MYHKDNFVIFDDSDSMTDYFHNYSLGQKSTIEWLKEKGANVIVVHVSNNDSSIPFIRRIKQICKQCNYEYTDNSQEVHYKIQDVKEFVYEFVLTKKEEAK